MQCREIRIRYCSTPYRAQTNSHQRVGPDTRVTVLDSVQFLGFQVIPGPKSWGLHTGASQAFDTAVPLSLGDKEES